MQLTDHFSLEEFVFSETAARLGRTIVAPPEIVASLRSLCERVLEPIRVQLGLPMIITSGFRPDWLNTQIGGSRTSAHIFGNAADVRVVGMSPKAFCLWLQAHAQHLPIDQVIYEGTWTHIATSETPRYQYLTAHFTGKGVTYSPGIV